MACLCYFVSFLIVWHNARASSSFRLFRQSATQNVNNSANVIQKIEYTVLESLHCAIYCNSNSNCLAFNYMKFPNKTSNCHLLNVKNPTPVFQLTSNLTSSYYEEDCTRFVPTDYCLNGGSLQWVTNASCKASCICLHPFSGDRCQYNCTFRSDPHKEIFNGDYDITHSNEVDVQKCLEYCLNLPTCMSVLSKPDESFCIFKSRSILDEGVTSDCSDNRILYSKICKP